MTATASYSSTGHSVFARLRNMVNYQATGKGGYFDRLTLAHGLLRDAAWVTDPSGGGGDEGKAIDRLERFCFGDLTGAGLSLTDLLYVYDNMPVESWAKHDFNFARMKAELRSREAPAARPETPARIRTAREFIPPASFQEIAEDAPGRARQEYERLYRRELSDAEKISRLKARISELEEACGKKDALIETLRARLEKYEPDARRLTA